MFKLAEYILDHKEISSTQVPTIKNFGGEEPMYKYIKNIPTSQAIDMLAAEWRDRPPVYPNIRKEVYWPTEKTAGIQDAPVEGNMFDDLSANFNYTKYLLKHKANVLDGGIKAGVGPFTLLAHDWSKFKPSSFGPYRDYIFGINGIKGNNTPETFNAFRRAAARHYKAEDHHSYKLGIPGNLNTRMESVVDWYSVQKSNAEMNGKFFMGFKTWWNKNKEKFLMSGSIDKEVYDAIEHSLQYNYHIWSYSVDQLRNFFRGL